MVTKYEIEVIIFLLKMGLNTLIRNIYQNYEALKKVCIFLCQFSTLTSTVSPFVEMVIAPLVSVRKTLPNDCKDFIVSLFG